MTDTNSKVQFDILQFIKNIQSKNGIRDNQYIRYRQYCTRRLHRVKLALRLTSKNSKYKEFDLLPSDYKSVDHLSIPVLLVERNWAYGMELQATLNDTEVEKSSAVRNHSIRKFSKARKSALELLKVAEEVCDHGSVFQIRAYARYMEGVYGSNVQDWELAVESLTESVQIYEELCKSNNIDLSTIANERLSTVRVLCKYSMNKLRRVNAQHPLLSSSSKQDGIQLPSSLLESTSLDTIEYKGTTLNIKDKQLAKLLGILREVEIQKLSQAVGSMKYNELEEVFSQHLTAVDDSLVCVKGLVKDLSASKSQTSVVQNELVVLQQVQELLETKRAAVTVDMALVTVAQHGSRFNSQKLKVKPSQSGIGVQGLCVVLERVLPLATDLKVQVGTALHAYYLAHAYDLQHKPVEALALFKATVTQLEQVVFEKTHTDAVVFHLELLSKAILADKDAEERKFTQKAVKNTAFKPVASTAKPVDLLSMKPAGIVSTQDSLLDHPEELRVYAKHTYGKLGLLPPPLTPAPAKPFLFDLALNSIVYPQYAAPSNNNQEVNNNEGDKGFWGRIWG